MLTEACLRSGGSTYDIRDLLNATIQLRDGRPLSEMKLGFMEDMVIKGLLKRSRIQISKSCYMNIMCSDEPVSHQILDDRIFFCTLPSHKNRYGCKNHPYIGCRNVRYWIRHATGQ